MATKALKMQRYAFESDLAIPPGETLKETLGALGMTQVEVAERTGRPKKTISEIVQGKAAITPDTAMQLERVLGVPASFWNNLEQNYRTTLARLAEQERFEKHMEWAKKFPLSDLRKRGVLPEGLSPGESVNKLLGFLGLGSPGVWETWWTQQQAAFRASPKFKASDESVAAWLRLGELQANNIECGPYDRTGFANALKEIRGLTREPVKEAAQKVVELCAAVGVAVVFVKRLPKVPLSGATRWLSSDRALIQLSLRYKKDDQLWFSFFHEAMHILHHRKRKIYLNTDGSGYEEEEEANRLAGEVLIPMVAYEPFLSQYRNRITKTSVKTFANQLGIAPGIVVGRLQHDGYVLHSHLNDLKVTLKWAS
jgi:HTH-type transcriptional regulator/antitoxin HigA